jgi:hypothetical protein
MSVDLRRSNRCVRPSANKQVCKRPRATDGPPMIRLQESTYRQYKGIRKRFLCFVYRTTQSIRLDHRLVALTEDSSETDRLASAREKMDESCLDLCKSILDHDLKGDLSGSDIVCHIV